MSVRHIIVLAFVLAAPSFLASIRVALAAEEDLSVNARLLLAARNADPAALARELKQGAAANARNRLGETALLIAIKKNELGMANTHARGRHRHQSGRRQRSHAVDGGRLRGQASWSRRCSPAARTSMPSIG